ncbi:MAG TPA: ABC transporter ATP-binding protein [Afipia sp.]
MDGKMLRHSIETFDKGRITDTEPTHILNEDILVADRLSVVYQSSRGPQRAIDDLTLSIKTGEFVSILGPSGCGKSTFLNVVAGLLRATSGVVTVRGEAVAAPRADIGVVFQKPTLLPWATVLQNVLVPIRALNRDVEAATPRAIEILSLVGLGDFAHHYPQELSGGMQQRVGIARALIHDPGLLLMDEPFAALDAMTRERMSQELLDIWEASGKTVLFITHSIPEAVFLSDRIFIMTASPARLHDEVIVDLPRPRSLDAMSAPEFGSICGRIRRMFTERVQA